MGRAWRLRYPGGHGRRLRQFGPQFRPDSGKYRGSGGSGGGAGEFDCHECTTGGWKRRAWRRGNHAALTRNIRLGTTVPYGAVNTPKASFCRPITGMQVPGRKALWRAIAEAGVFVVNTR